MKEHLAELEANLRAELDSQRALLAGLEAMVRALQLMDREAIERALTELARLGFEGARLAEERRRVLGHLGSALGEDPAKLKLREISRRAGEGGASLEAIRAELRAETEKVHELGRKLGLLVRHFRDVYGTALDLVFRAAGIETTGDAESRVPAGMMVDEEG